MKAQGNALGAGPRNNQALKGRDTPTVNPTHIAHRIAHGIAKAHPQLLGR
jgi:hypothetical protein